MSHSRPNATLFCLFLMLLTGSWKGIDAFSTTRRSSLRILRPVSKRAVAGDQSSLVLSAASVPTHEVQHHAIGDRSPSAAVLKVFGAFVASWFWRIRAASASTVGSTLPEPLGLRHLFFGAGMMLSVSGVVMSSMGLISLAKDILIAAIRCTVQLSLLGSVVLHCLLGTTRPLLVWSWIVGVGILGAFEAFSRVEYTYPELRRHVIISVLTSGLSVLVISLLGGVFGELTPWYRPRTLIPVAGMLFGNTLSAATLGASTLTKEFATSKSRLELRLARGATSREATFPITRSALVSALTPTINSLSVTGIIHIPGMMTGQVLAGQSALQAAAYQGLILFLITTAACGMVQLLTRQVVHSLMDMKRHRLNTDKLVPKDKSTKGPLSAPFEFLASRFRRQQKRQDVFNGAYINGAGINGAGINGAGKYPASENTLDRIAVARPLGQVIVGGSAPVLMANKVRIERADVKVSFSLRNGDRLGITGASGAGKTQTLRTIIGLEPGHDLRDLKLNGDSPRKIGWPSFRRQICWVSQDRPTLDGTPRDFLEQVRRYSSQQRVQVMDPEVIAKGWGLPESAFDRPWTSLSGGEAQRVSIALALSLRPKVLLLDEATSALDSATALIVEDSLKQSGIPIIVVTHSKEQLERFCTQQLDLTSAQVTSAMDAV